MNRPCRAKDVIVMGIRTKLVLCLLAVLLPLVAVSSFAISLLDQQLVERTESALANTRRLEAARINEILAAYANDARGLASGAHIRQFVAATNTYRRTKRDGGDLQELQGMTIGGYDGFAIVDQDAEWPLQQLALAAQRKAGIVGSEVVELKLVDDSGETLGETLGYSWTPADPSLLTQTLRSVKTRFGDAFVNDNGDQRLGMMSPVVSDSGEVVGAMLLETRLGPIIDLVSKHEGVGRSSEAHIAQPTVDGHAQFITALRFDRKAAFDKVVPEAKHLPIIQAMDSLGGNILHARDYRGVDSILAIETIPDTGWGLVVKIDQAEAYAPVYKLRRLLIIAAALSIVFVLVCYMFCLVPIARRLKRTAVAARKVMNGDLTTRVSDTIHDEIGHLAGTIDTLARELEADQKKRTEVEARLRHQALHDELTGLLNRQYANSVIQQLNADTRHSHTVMFLDLNGFKDVNDLYGHAAGDEVLIDVAGRLSRRIEDGVTLARWGGDEFVVILPCCEEDAATEFALSLHNAFDEPVVSSQGVHKLSCSIGLATSSDTKSLDDVLMEADILMYEQKKRMRQNRTKVNMAARTVERALKEDRVEVWYQPIVRFQRPGSYDLAGAEALVRVRSREGGIVGPEDFLPEVDSRELGSELDRCVLSQALGSLTRWNETGIVGRDFKLSLNVTAQSLNDPAFSAILNNQLQIASVSPEQIIIELPHYSKVDPMVITHLRMLGVTMALDRMGEEPANLGQTSRLQPDIAKIDRRWLGDDVVAPHMVSICDELELKIIVEGIETREQMAALHALGIKYFQGFLFDRPLRAVDFISRWGESSVHGLGDRLSNLGPLRLVS
ncbi:MAG: EAL domain-containing protein [Granulosicoccus sp.]|nr:EAL domain-containing protein [Granulosicoccus sp.]